MNYILYKNADWIITMDDARTRLRHGDLLVCDNRIQAIGKGLREQYPEIKINKEIDASGKIIVPGFVNTHHHT